MATAVAIGVDTAVGLAVVGAVDGAVGPPKKKNALLLLLKKNLFFEIKDAIRVYAISALTDPCASTRNPR